MARLTNTPDVVFSRPSLSTVVILGFWITQWLLIAGPFVIMLMFAGPSQ